MMVNSEHYSIFDFPSVIIIIIIIIESICVWNIFAHGQI